MSRESYENYDRVVARLSDKHRVILCRDGVQWILQRKISNEDDCWRGRSFCRTKEALLRCIGENAGPIPVDALIILNALPDWAEHRPQVEPGDHEGDFPEDPGSEAA
jgi:hypothetical protein